MSTHQQEIRDAIEIVKERGLLVPSSTGGGRLDGHVVERVLLDAVDDAGEVNPYILAFARQIIANSR